MLCCPARALGYTFHCYLFLEPIRILFFLLILENIAFSPQHRIWSTEMLFQNFHIFHNILLNFAKFRGGHFRKECRSRKKESKPSEIKYKKSAPARTILKIKKRWEFVWSSCSEQCPNNSFKRLYIVKGLLVLEGKASFSKEFRCEFQNVNAAVERAMSGFEGGQKKVMSLKKIRKKKKNPHWFWLPASGARRTL